MLSSYKKLLGPLALVVGLLAPSACGQAAEDVLYDLCDQGSCSSEPDCPGEPPTAGLRCELADGSACYYCRENERYDAHHYECDNGRWERRANEDCG